MACGKLAEDGKTFAVLCLSVGHVFGFCGFLPTANADILVDLVVGMPHGGGLDRSGRS